MPSEYSRLKIPPAPILEIKLSPPREGMQTDSLVALIDTGADFTLVPLDWLLQIDAPEVRYAYLRGLWSEQRQATLYLVDLHFDSTVLPGIEVIGLEHDEDDDQEIILGRNVLNKLILLLDGPSEQVDILDRRPQRL
jgi:predicted aspartyl protease